MSQKHFHYKQVIAVRTDLKMSTGKIAGQVAHACLLAALQASNHYWDWWKQWMEEKYCKIVVKVENESGLFRLLNEATKNKIPCALIRDLGYTQIARDTSTCVAIGPAPIELINPITKDLPLLN